MAGETTVLHFPFAGGLDEKIAKEYLDASSRQASILNGDFVKVGAIDKRNGLVNLPVALVAGGILPAPSSGKRVVGWSRSSLSVLCASGLYQYVTAPVGGTTSGGLVGVAQLPAVACVRKHITTGTQSTTPVLADLTYQGKLLRIVLFWDSAYNIQASVYEVASGNAVLEPVVIYTNNGSIGAATVPRIVSAFDLPGIANGSPRTMVVIQDLATTAVKFVQYNPSTNTFTAPTQIVASCAMVDAAPYEGDPANGWLVCYNTNATTVRLAYWTTTQQSTSDATSASLDLSNPCYVAGRYGQSVWTAFSSFSGNTVFDNAFTYTATATPTLITNGLIDAIGSATAGRWQLTGLCHLGTNKVFCTYYASDTVGRPTAGPNTRASKWAVMQYSTGTVTVLASGKIDFGLLPATRPFVVNGAVYQPMYYDLNYIYNNSNSLSLQVTLYLCQFFGVSDTMAGQTFQTSNCRPVATIAPRFTSHQAQTLADSLGNYHMGFASTAVRTATQVAVGVRTNGDITSTTATSQINISSGASWAADLFWDTGHQQSLYQTSELGGELSVSGGVPFVADGQSAFEDGFFNYPEFSYAQAAGAAGTSLPTGQYTFAVVYRALDNTGLSHRSAPFVLAPLSITNGGNGPFLTITPPIVSYRDVLATSATLGAVYADIYMTTANGSTLYYYDSIVVSNIQGPTYPYLPIFVNYPPSGGAAISGPSTTAPLLYTTGGVMSNVNPPASRIQITHQSRKALVDETGQRVWFSQEFSDGQAPGFNEALVVPYPDGGDITALGSMDNKFVVFKQRSIWIMEGNGPSVTGQGSSWSVPESLSTDVGATSWQSVVLTPKGLMFQGPNNGIYLLGRDLQITFIGKNVIERTNAYPVVVSASLVSSSTQVRFLCQDVAGVNHLVIVYDYLLDTWTTHQYAQLSAVPVATCVSYGATPQYTVLAADGNLWQERLPTDPARYMDQNAAGTNFFVPTTLKIPYVKTQVQGYQRLRSVQAFCEQQDNCGLQMQLAFNYDDTVKQTGTWTSTQLAALPVKGQVGMYVDARYNKQMAAQLTISDTAGTAMTTGAGMRFVSAALELQNLGPRYKLMPKGARR